MVDIDIRYEGDLRCRLTHRPSGAVIVTDAPRDNEGKGESFSPTDLVAAALGSCMVTIMGIVARRHGMNIDGSRVHVEKEMHTGAERRIRRLAVAMTLPAALTADQRSLLEHAAETCPVLRSLGAGLEVPVRFVYA